ncbi:PsaJ protein [Nostoc parmelioides]|uniref:PsaJ protein n=1 Tax=Nostoc parmelioides FACHB-3921 TaxID=2692909 RepID=A0ABR8BNE3_9NOSO|nr:PsaJ protein [Nostoc parmelioides]MBD2255632.1 PsaJ protein [Nostoc parmelioides FACHB-3921]
MTKSKDQEKKYFLQYLSLAPVLAVISISVAFSTWAIFNYIFPDLLFHPLP